MPCASMHVCMYMYAYVFVCVCFCVNVCVCDWHVHATVCICSGVHGGFKSSSWSLVHFGFSKCSCLTGSVTLLLPVWITWVFGIQIQIIELGQPGPYYLVYVPIYKTNASLNFHTFDFELYCGIISIPIFKDAFSLFSQQQSHVLLNLTCF